MLGYVLCECHWCFLGWGSLLGERAGEDACLLPLSMLCCEDGVSGEAKVSISSLVLSMGVVAGCSPFGGANPCASAAREWDVSVSLLPGPSWASFMAVL